jgi:hypothetical protein
MTTNITTTTETTTVTVTENVVEIELNNVGVQGTPGLSGVVSVVSPITNVGSAGSAIVGINQALLSITKSQVSDFTSGTVTSASTAQQAGTAVYAVNSGTAVFATTAGTSTTISGSITKSQVSDFTSGTVASAGTAQQAGTAVYAVNSGTAVYATTSGTAVTISGSITKSQVSDFTSGTVTSASTAQQSGTAVFATTSGTAVTISGNIPKSQVSDFTSGTVTSASTAQQSGTATYATNAGTSVYATNSGTAVFATNAGTAVFATTSGTATFATNAGTAVFATNASTAVSVSGSAITQSQITGLVSDLAGKANLAGGNAFTGAQTVTGTATGSIVQIIRGASGQANDFFSIQNSGGTALVRANLNGSFFFGQTTGSYPTFFGASGSLAGMINVVPASAAVIPIIVRGAASQTASMMQFQNDAGSITANFTAPVNNVNRLNLGGTDLSATFGITVHASGGVGQVIRAAASQTANLQEWQNSAGTIQARIDPAGMATVGALGVQGNPSGISYALFGTPSASAIPVVIRGAASQSADLLQIQNSASTNLVRVDSGGGLFASQGAKLGLDTFTGIAYNGISNPSGVTTIPSLVVKANPSQTSSMQEWHNSAGTVLAKIESTGAASFSSGNATIGSGGIIRGTQVSTNVDYSSLREENSGGLLRLTKQTAAAANPVSGQAKIYLRDGTTLGTLKLVVRAGAAGAETTILDNIPQ